MNTTATRRHRREKIVDFGADGPADQVSRVKSAIASIKKPGIYWVGVKVRVQWNPQVESWSIAPIDAPTSVGDETKRVSQRELMRALALAFIDHGLSVLLPPQP